MQPFFYRWLFGVEVGFGGECGNGMRNLFADKCGDIACI